MGETSAIAQEMTLADFPFWQANAGWWRSENTYFDEDLNYIIRSYNSVVHIELDGRRFRETEFKSYAPSKLAIARGRGKIMEGEGIETVTITTGELVDDRGTVRITGMRPAMPGVSNTTIIVLDAAKGARVTKDPDSGRDAYQMLITLPTPERRYVANFGLVSSEPNESVAGSEVGDLRGFALFSSQRIQVGEAPAWRARYRAKNRVAAVIEAGPEGTETIRRLDAEEDAD